MAFLLGIIGLVVTMYCRIVGMILVGCAIVMSFNYFNNPDMSEKALSWSQLQDYVEVRGENVRTSTTTKVINKVFGVLTVARDYRNIVKPGQKHPETGQDLVVATYNGQSCWFVRYEEPKLDFLERLTMSSRGKRQMLEKEYWNIWKCARIVDWSRLTNEESPVAGDQNTYHMDHGYEMRLPIKPADIPMPPELDQKMCNISVWECPTDAAKRKATEQQQLEASARLAAAADKKQRDTEQAEFERVKAQHLKELEAQQAELEQQLQTSTKQ